MRTKRVVIPRGIGSPGARERLRGEIKPLPALDDPSFWRAIGPAGSTLGNPYKQLAWTFAGIRTIAQVAASIPIRVYTGARPRYRSSPLVDPVGFIRERSRADGDSTKKVVENGALVDLFEAPCPTMTRSQAIALTIVYMYTCGEAGWLALRSGKAIAKGDMPEEFWPRRTKGWTLEIDERTKLPKLWKDQTRTYIPEAVVHYKFADPENPNRGFSPLDPARVDMEGDYAAATFNRQFFKNGAHPGGILKSDKLLVKTQRDQLLAALEESVRGDERAHSTLLLESGVDFLWNPRSQKDAEFSELRRSARDVQLAVIGCQKAALSITDNLNYATALGQRRLLIENTIIPLLVDFEDALWSQLFRHVQNGREWVEWDFSSVPALQDDLGAKATTARSLFDMGYSRDEVNKRLSLGFPEDARTDVRGGPGLNVGTEEPPASTPDPATPKPGETPQANAAAALAAGNSVQDLALNGAQIQSLVDLAAKVQAGELPAASALGIIVAAYPTIDAGEAAKIINPAAAAAAKANTGNPSAGAPSSDSGLNDGSPFPTPTPASAEGTPPDEEPDTTPAEPRADEGAIALGHALLLVRADLDPETFRRQWIERVDKNVEALVRKVMAKYLEKLAQDQVERFEAHVRELATQRLTEGDIDAILFNREEWDRFIKQDMGPSLKRAQDVASRRLARELGVKIIDVSNPAMLEIHAGKVARLVQINGVTQRAIRSTLIEGVAANETVDDIRFRLNSVLEGVGGNDRALRIARTEVGMIQQATRQQGMKDQGVTKKKWWSILAPGTRDTHRREHGGIVGIDERFPVTGLLHPKEMGGNPDEVVNCDCDLLAVVEDQ